MEYPTRQYPEYDAWLNMKRRCYDSENRRYPRYGGRGIRVCDRWLGRDGFKNFLSDMGRRPVNTKQREWSIDRIDNNGDYAPENCRWATAKEQSSNRKSNLEITLWGNRYCVSEACEMLKINRHNFYRYNATHRENSAEDNFTNYLVLLGGKEKRYV